MKNSTGILHHTAFSVENNEIRESQKIKNKTVNITIRTALS
jgi:hypothetical protein